MVIEKARIGRKLGPCLSGCGLVLERRGRVEVDGEPNIDINERRPQLLPPLLTSRFQRVITRQHLRSLAPDDHRPVLPVHAQALTDRGHIAPARIPPEGLQRPNRDKSSLVIGQVGQSRQLSASLGFRTARKDQNRVFLAKNRGTVHSEKPSKKNGPLR